MIKLWKSKKNQQKERRAQVKKAIERDIAHMVHPFTNLKAHEDVGPIILKRGEGCYVYDIKGNRYLEGFAALWCANLGFSEQRLVKAATKQLEKLPYYHTFSHRSHDVGIKLATKLVDLKPVKDPAKALNKVFFTSSGSSANDTAIKIIRCYNNALDRPKKKNIIARKRGYHGVGIGSGSLSYFPHMHPTFDMPIKGIHHTDCPDYFRDHKTGESEEEFATRMVNNLEKLIKKLGGVKKCAAFVAEPIMGVAGVIPPPKTYWEKIEALLKKYDMLLVADEVVTGFGRTGQMFGSHTCKIEPDIMVLAKGLSAAYLPIAATMMNDKVYNVIAQESADQGVFGHGYTYSAHPVSAAVALETINIVEERNIPAHVRKMHKVLMKRLHEFKGHPIVGDIRGVGLMAAVELVKNPEKRMFFDEYAKVSYYLFNRAMEHGVILRAMGDAVGFSPPLVIDEAEIHEMVDAFALALDETYTWVQKEGLL